MQYLPFNPGKSPKNKIGHPCLLSPNQQSAVVVTSMTLSMASSRRSLRFTVKTVIFSPELPPRKENSIAWILTSTIQTDTSPLLHSVHLMLATMVVPQPPKATTKKIAIHSPNILAGLSKLSSIQARLRSHLFRADRWSRLSKSAKITATWQELMALIAKSECRSLKKSLLSPTLPTKKMTNTRVAADQSIDGLLLTPEARSISMILLLPKTTNTKALSMASKLTKSRNNL